MWRRGGLGATSVRSGGSLHLPARLRVVIGGISNVRVRLVLVCLMTGRLPTHASDRETTTTPPSRSTDDHDNPDTSPGRRAKPNAVTTQALSRWSEATFRRARISVLVRARPSPGVSSVGGNRATLAGFQSMTRRRIPWSRAKAS